MCTNGTIISSYGTASKSIVADVVDLRLVARGRDKNSKSAATKLMRQSATQFLKALKPLLDPETDEAELGQVYERELTTDAGKLSSVLSEASIIVHLTAKKAGKKRGNPFAKVLGDILALAEEHDVFVTSVDFGLSRQIRDQVTGELLEAAAAEARKRAASLAKGAGSVLGRVLAIDPPNGFFDGGSTGGGGGGGVTKSSARKSLASEEEKGEADWTEALDASTVPKVWVTESTNVFFELELDF